MKEFLTDEEKQAIKMCGDLWGLVTKIVGHGPSREADLREMIHPIHELQRSIMAQAAARAYPELYRALGEMLK